MSNLTSSGKNNPCPICSDLSGKCRQSGDRLVLCMTNAERSEVNGYKYIGVTKDGLWGKYVKNDGQAYQNSYNQKPKALGSHKTESKKKQDIPGLSVVDRDHGYRELLDQLVLDDEDRQDLIKRGLSDEAIARGMFRSVDKDQKLSKPMKDSYLAGISHDGKKLTVANSGYLVPITTADNKIIGCQLRLRLRTEDGGGRYRWLYTPKRQALDWHDHDLREIKSNLCNGELPIGVYRPSQLKITDSIGTTEGHLKPFVASQNLGQIVIGASGGQFASNPENFKQQLDQISADLGNCKLLIDYVDAGVVQNNQVLGQLNRKWDLVESWGYTVKIAWWGQIAKDKFLDIDELSSEAIAEIKYISRAEFEAICKEFVLEKVESNQAKPKINPIIEDIKDRLLNQIETKPHLEIQIAGQFATKQERSQILAALPETGLIFLAASLGFGKTEINGAAIKDSKLIVSLSHLVTLAMASAERFGINYFNDDRSSKTKTSLCIQSLLSLRDLDFTEYIIVFDEFPQILEALITSKTCNKDNNRDLYLQLFAKIFRDAKRIIVSSADVSQREIQLVNTLRGKDDLFLVKATKKAEGFKVIFLNNYSEKGKKNADLLFSHALDAAMSDKKILFFSDTKADSRRFYKMLITAGITAEKILLVNSSTSGEEKQKAFIKNPNKEQYQYQIIISSPSINSGLSITQPHFEVVYGCFRNVLTAAEHAQSLKRLRLNIDRFVFVADTKVQSPISDSTDPKEVLKALQNRTKLSTMTVKNNLEPARSDEDRRYFHFDTDWDNPFIRYYCESIAWRNIQLESPELELRARLELDGCNVSVQTAETKCEEIHAARIELEAERKESLKKSEIKRGRDLKELIDRPIPTEDEQIIIEASVLAEFYRVEKLTDEIIELDDKGDHRKNVRKLEEFLNKKNAVDTDRFSMTKRGDTFTGFAPDLKTKTVTAELTYDLIGKGILDTLPESFNKAKDYLATHRDLEIIASETRAIAKNVGDFVESIPKDTENADTSQVDNEMIAAIKKLQKQVNALTKLVKSTGDYKLVTDETISEINSQIELLNFCKKDTPPLNSYIYKLDGGGVKFTKSLVRSLSNLANAIAAIRKKKLEAIHSGFSLDVLNMVRLKIETYVDAGHSALFKDFLGFSLPHEPKYRSGRWLLASILGEYGLGLADSRKVVKLDLGKFFAMTDLLNRRCQVDFSKEVQPAIAIKLENLKDILKCETDSVKIINNAASQLINEITSVTSVTSNVVELVTEPIPDQTTEQVAPTSARSPLLKEGQQVLLSGVAWVIKLLGTASAQIETVLPNKNTGRKYETWHFNLNELIPI